MAVITGSTGIISATASKAGAQGKIAAFLYTVDELSCACTDNVSRQWQQRCVEYCTCVCAVLVSVAVCLGYTFSDE